MVRCDDSCRIPSLLMRVENIDALLLFCSSDRAIAPRRSNDNVTLLLTLFTFWPPGPPLREVVYVSSFSGLMTPETISIMFFVHDDSALTSRYKNSLPS